MQRNSLSERISAPLQSNAPIKHSQDPQICPSCAAGGNQVAIAVAFKPVARVPRSIG